MFHLRKWYLDCTTADGTALIGYRAHARFGALHLSYAGLLHRSPDGRVTTSSTLHASDEPSATAASITWACPKLGIDAAWSPLAPPVERTLLTTAAGSVRWNCLTPRAACTFTRNNTTHQGHGYVEHLELSIAPWNLPIHELRWGRWISPHNSLVWLDWQGPHPLTLIFDDSQSVQGTITDDSITLHDRRTLSLSNRYTLRDGQLGATVLRNIPGLSTALPPAILHTREQKWLSHATLNSDSGWAIHECVRFGT